MRYRLNLQEPPPKVDSKLLITKEVLLRMAMYNVNIQQNYYLYICQEPRGLPFDGG